MTVSDLVRHPQGRVAEKIAEYGEAAVATSAIVAAELRFGARKKESERLITRVDAILRAMEVIAFEAPSDAAYGDLRCALESRGRLIGGNDMLIAAQALALDRTLVTDNAREFKQVPGLRLANWLR